MRKIFLLGLFVGLSNSAAAQKLILSTDQNFAAEYNYHNLSTGERASGYKWFNYYSPAVNITWYGLTSGVQYLGQNHGLIWNWGYTLTLTPDWYFRANGKGLKIGATLGLKDYLGSDDQEARFFGFRSSLVKYSLGWQSDTYLVGVYWDWFNATDRKAYYHAGLRIGYALK